MIFCSVTPSGQKKITLWLMVMSTLTIRDVSQRRCEFYGKRRRIQLVATGKTHGVINGAGEVVEQNIDSTIRENYMPYAARAAILSVLFEIDGFKGTAAQKAAFIQCIQNGL